VPSAFGCRFDASAAGDVPAVVVASCFGALAAWRRGRFVDVCWASGGGFGAVSRPRHRLRHRHRHRHWRIPLGFRVDVRVDVRVDNLCRDLPMSVSLFLLPVSLLTCSIMLPIGFHARSK
jgi:hypothetical protein